MTPAEYVEMVSYIEDRWGTSSVWASAERLYDDFAELDTYKIYEALVGRITSDPSSARFAPKPAELVSLTLERMRRPVVDPPVAITVGAGSWADYAQKTYGKPIPLAEAIQRRHRELTT